MRESAATYTALLQNASKGTLTMHWPPDMARLYGSEAYEDAFCTDAWIEVDPSSLSRLVDSVRSRLLGFAIAIEAENPDAGEADIRTTPVDPKRVTQVFKTVIYGGTNNVAAGSSNVAQHSPSPVPPGDIQSLKARLASVGTEPQEIQKLESELGLAITPEDKKRAAGGWLVDHMAGAKDFASDVMGKAIAEFLKG